MEPYETWSVREAAALTGVTKRTLHYYDEIGLLRPAEVTAAGYRRYSAADLDRLQEILFYREAGFSLQEIRRLLDLEPPMREAALAQQIEILTAKKARLARIIRLIEGRLSGAETVSFDAFSSEAVLRLQAQLRAEAAERWGGTAYYGAFEANRDGDREWVAYNAWMQSFLARLADIAHRGAADSAVQEMVQSLRAYITAHFYPCDTRALSQLGVLYSADERFTAYIDRFGPGLAAFLSDAIGAYCEGRS